MQNELTVPSEAAARALARSPTFLSQFLTPQSPSEVADRVGMAANLAHHHARKLEGLGLLREERREAGRVYYQLAARQFRVPMDLLPPGDPDENAARTVRELSAEFLNANARSWSCGRSTTEGAVYGFGVPEDDLEACSHPTIGSDEPYPAHLDALTLRLTPERHRTLALALIALLSEAYSEGHSRSGEVCTLVVLGFRDIRPAMQGSQSHGVSRATSTFLPWPARNDVPGNS